jgi:hypothetical protein
MTSIGFGLAFLSFIPGMLVMEVVSRQVVETRSPRS